MTDNLKNSVGIVKPQKVRVIQADAPLELKCGKSFGPIDVAYETYGPRSAMRIFACSSNLRRRAAHDAPPATPPTMMTFIFPFLLSILCFLPDPGIQASLR